jgi:hypothetical protein
MNATAKRVRLKKIRIALGINLPICIMSIIIGLQSLDGMVFWKVGVCALSFIISLNLIILFAQYMIRLQQTD